MAGAGCRSRVESGIDLKLGSFRQNGKIPDLSWEAEIQGTGANWGFIEFLLRALTFARVSRRFREDEDDFSPQRPVLWLSDGGCLQPRIDP